MEIKKAELEWIGGLQFSAKAGTQGVLIDGEAHAGPSPMEALLFALAGCMSADLVYILARRNAELKTVRALIKGLRTDTDPKRYTRITLHFQVAGRGFETKDIDQAITISREKYCSVYHSLRSDIELVVTFEIL
jgi:putative redox protein